MSRVRAAAVLLFGGAFTLSASEVPVESPSTPPARHERITELSTSGRHDEAVALARDWVRELDGSADGPSPDLAAGLEALYRALRRAGAEEAPSALEIVGRLIQVHEQLHGPQSVEVAAQLVRLAVVLHLTARTDETIEPLRRAVAIRVAKLGPGAAEVASARVRLANAYQALGFYTQARRQGELALASRERLYGADDVRVAASLNNLATVLIDTGDLATARPLLERSAVIQKERRGATHPATARAAVNLGALLQAMGDYGAARRLYTESLRDVEAALGPDDPRLAPHVNNLAAALHAIGDYPASRKLFERAVRLKEAEHGSAHPDYATALANLAAVEQSMERYDAAAEKLGRVLDIRRASLGDDSPAVAKSYKSLGRLQQATGRHDEALRSYTRAIALQERRLGSDHHEVATTLQARGALLREMGELGAALLDLETVVEIRRARLGDSHPMLADAWIELGRLRVEMRQPGAAHDAASRAVQLAREHTLLTVQALSEREALLYAQLCDEALDLLLSVAISAGGRGHVAAAWDALARFRARVLDEMARRHRTARSAGKPELAEMSRRLSEARTRLAGLFSSGGERSHPEVYQRALVDARRDKERLERELARLMPSPGESGKPGLEEIARSLPDRSALLAYARHRYHRAPTDDSTAESSVPVSWYSAFLLRSDAPEPIGVSLGRAEWIDDRVRDWRELVDAPDELALRRVGGDLRKLIWDPVESYLEGVEMLFVVLDGALHRVNLAALPDGDGFLVQRDLLFHHLAAERDLLRPPATRYPGGLLALGAPDFDLELRSEDGAPVQVATRGRIVDCETRWSELPETGREALRIAETFRSVGGETAVITGDRATEATLREQVSGRRVIHLATHGEFLPRSCEETPFTDPPGSEELHPLLRSRVLLAGANQAAVRPAEDDGILTAEEMASLDLGGVQWVVLSACDTGLGELVDGEGVIGLQRALRAAGAATVVMSLWDVDDAATRQWMEQLYERRFRRGMSTAEAVRAASRALLASYPPSERRAATSPFYWAAFVAIGDWR